MANQKKRVHFIEVGDELHKHSIQEIGSKCLQILDNQFCLGDHLVLDLSETNHISDKGIAMMVSLDLKIKERGSFSIIASKQVKKVLNIVFATSYFTIHPDRETALQVG